MQQFTTSNEFQGSSKFKIRYTRGAERSGPSVEVVQTLLMYAAALRVFKTKSLGVLNILMN